MLYEYKIQKIADGNGDERFDVCLTNVLSHRWYKWKVWTKYKGYDGYLKEMVHTTLGEAQEAVRTYMERDKKTEYENNKTLKKVLKEYKYTKIPKYIPVEQHEKFCDLKGTTL